MNSKRNLRTSVFYNRSNPVYGLDYTFLDNVSKVLLTNGFDTRESEEHRLNTRFNLNRKFALFTTLTTGNRAYTSQFFTDRSFNYNFNSINPKLQYLYNNSLRVELNFKYSNAINKAAFGGETAENYEAGLDFKLSRLQKGVIQTGASYVNVSYNGDPSTTLGYELLQGLQDGNNATWKLSYQRTVAKNIQFIMSYDGRKSKDIDAIHIGRVVARYLF
jgi:hypothetical protein